MVPDFHEVNRSTAVRLLKVESNKDIFVGTFQKFLKSYLRGHLGTITYAMVMKGYF